MKVIAAGTFNVAGIINAIGIDVVEALPGSIEFTLRGVTAAEVALLITTLTSSVADQLADFDVTPDPVDGTLHVTITTVSLAGVPEAIRGTYRFGVLRFTEQVG